MIDLRRKGLPDTIEVDGRLFLINTDFRIWLQVGEILTNDKTTLVDVAKLVFNDMSLLDLIKNETEIRTKILDFYINENITPKSVAQTKTKIVDYIQDGEYIVGSFMQAYGIDLTSCDMHWHLFKALFLSLPDETKIKNIMKLRAYTKTNKSFDSQCAELKQLWSLPSKNIQDENLLNDINDEFYNS